MSIPPIPLAPLVLTDLSCEIKTISTGNNLKKGLSKSSELIQIGPDDRHHSDSFDNHIELDKNKVVGKGYQNYESCDTTKDLDSRVCTKLGSLV